MNYARKLNAILSASGWSQEQLARELNVSFPTLNSWVNERSQPRPKAIQKIEELYLTIVGGEDVDVTELIVLKKTVLQIAFSPKVLLSDEESLKKLTLHLTYHTNTIEGSTMTLSDVEDVVFGQKVLSNRTAIEQTEARNHQAALYWLIDTLVADGKDFVINEGLVLGLHLRLMNGIIGDAGQYRKHAVRIMGTHVTLANWQKVPQLMQDFTTTYSKKSSDIITQLAESHAAFEKIHPFSDGNGRTGRLILLAQALQAGLIPPLVLKERKSAYYKYLALAQTEDNHLPLELFLAQSMQFCHHLLSD